jgi:hypothetical protein
VRHNIFGGLAGTGCPACTLQPRFNRGRRGTSGSQYLQPASQFIDLRGGQLFNGALNFNKAAHIVEFNTRRLLPARFHIDVLASLGDGLPTAITTDIPPRRSV